jgi:tetratricopeptide (TPR) repeat protein
MRLSRNTSSHRRHDQIGSPISSWRTARQMLHDRFAPLCESTADGMHTMARLRRGLAAVLIGAMCAGTASAQTIDRCGDIANAYGPYDYRTDKDKLGIVEKNHFDAGVENLSRGISAYLGGDIDYTLRAFPNHHRALAAMTRLSEKLKTEQPPQARYTVTCYYERAVRFRPDDGTVRMLYAVYLAKRGKAAEAVQHLKVAEEVVGENANLHYNMGLAYLDLKDYDRALAHAHRAYALGFPLPGLRNRLQRAGKWREPRGSGAAGAPAASAAGAAPARP